MKKSKWKYANAEGSQHGTMQCQKCGQKITAGEYRYKEMYHHFEFIGYVSHEHRSCADKGDAGWLIRENERSAKSKKTAARLDAFRAFSEQWDTAALDDDIEDMEFHLQNAENQALPR